MTPDELMQTLAHVGLTIASLARLLNRPAQTVWQWRLGRAGVPQDVQKWLRRLEAHLDADPPPGKN